MAETKTILKSLEENIIQSIKDVHESGYEQDITRLKNELNQQKLGYEDNIKLLKEDINKEKERSEIQVDNMTKLYNKFDEMRVVNDKIHKVLGLINTQEKSSLEQLEAHGINLSDIKDKSTFNLP